MTLAEEYARLLRRRQEVSQSSVRPKARVKAIDKRLAEIVPVLLSREADERRAG